MKKCTNHNLDNFWKIYSLGGTPRHKKFCKNLEDLFLGKKEYFILGRLKTSDMGGGLMHPSAR